MKTDVIIASAVTAVVVFGVIHYGRSMGWWYRDARMS